MASDPQSAPVSQTKLSTEEQDALVKTLGDNHPLFTCKDRVLVYGVEPWRSKGYGVVNFGDNFGTVNTAIHGLVDEIGEIQLAIATHIDMQRKQPPSINTVQRICKLMMRVHSVLSGRQKVMATQRVEAGHADPQYDPFIVHPFPYYAPSNVMRNKWLREFNVLTAIALSNMIQHSDNSLAMTVTSEFSEFIWQYFREIQTHIAIELLLIPRETAERPDFAFTEAHYQAYDPYKVIVNLEGSYQPGPLLNRFTEDDLRPLFEGYTTLEIAPTLEAAPKGLALVNRQGVSSQTTTSGTTIRPPTV